MNRWAIHIDIEGFGHTYGKGTQAIRSLGALMDGIFRIGTKCYPESSDRLFAHQLGDSFIVVSAFDSNNLEVPVSIAIALLQHVLAHGGTAKASIDEGDFADILGCYPRHIIDEMDDHGIIRLGSGIMTIFQVMGPALIQAVKVSGRAPSGSLLIIRDEFRKRLPEHLEITQAGNEDLLSIDWIHSRPKLLNTLCRKSGLICMDTDGLEWHIREYIANNQLSPTWIENTRRLLSLDS